MHDDLNQLKPILDESVFNKNPFNENSEQKITMKMNELQNRSNQKPRKIVLKPIMALVALLALCSFLFFLVIHGEEGSNQPATPTKQPQPDQHQTPMTDDNEDNESDDQSDETMVEPTKEDEVVEEDPPPEKDQVNKEGLYQLMLNNQSVLDTVKGTYRIQHNGKGNPITYHLVTRVGNEPAFYIHELSKDGLDNERLYKDNQILTLYHLSKEFSLSKDRDYQPSEILDFEYIFPKSEAKRYLEDFSLWSIKDHTKFLNLDTVVVKGDIKGVKGRHFEIWVHQTTGIWLKFKVYDDQGNTFIDMKMEKLALNPQLGNDTFTLAIPPDYFGEGQEHNAGAGEKYWYDAYKEIRKQYIKKGEVHDLEIFGEFKYVSMTIIVDPQHVTLDQFHEFGSEILNQLSERDPQYIDDHQFGLVLRTKDGSKKIDGYYSSDEKEFIIVESN